MSGLKLTPLEKSWVMYDVGNSAFILMLSTVIPIFFNSIAGDSLSAVDYLAFWGYAASIATLMCAFIGPVLGSISDRKGMRMKLFTGNMSLGIMSLLAFFIIGLMLFILSTKSPSVSMDAEVLSDQ